MIAAEERLYPWLLRWLPLENPPFRMAPASEVPEDWRPRQSGSSTWKQNHAGRGTPNDPLQNILKSGHYRK